MSSNLGGVPPDPASAPPPPAPSPPAPESPWDAYERAGITPEQYRAEEVQNAVNLQRSLQNRDWRDPALTQVLRADILREGETLADLRAAMESHRQSQEGNPWEQAYGQGGAPLYYDPQTGDPVYDQPQDAPGLDPRQLGQTVEQVIERRFADYERSQAEQRMKDAMEQEFMREMDARRASGGYSDFEVQSLAGQAVAARNANPTLTPKEAFDSAERAYQEALNARLAQMGQRQAGAAPTTTPSGPVPDTESPPTSLEEAAARSAQVLGTNY